MTTAQISILSSEMAFHGSFGSMELNNTSTMETIAFSDLLDTSSTFTENEFEKHASGLIIGGKQYVRDHLEISIPYLLIGSALCVFGTLGNLCVLGAVAVHKALQNSRSVFLVNLAIADLIVTSIADPFAVVGLVEGKQYFDGRPLLCDAVATICLGACVTVLLTIGGISFNRYFHICHPDIYPSVFTLRNNIVMCACFWVFSIFMCLPGLLGWTDNVYDHKIMECLWNRAHSRSYTLFFALFVVATPISIIGFSYFKIFMKFRQSKKNIESIDKEESKDEKKEAKRRQSSLKLARTLFFIFMVFVLCWAPYTILICIDFEDRYPMEVYLFTVLLAHMHSTLNPFVYLITNAHFRQGYQILLRILFCKGYKTRFNASIGASVTGTAGTTQIINVTSSSIKPPVKE